jgi:hypothetical protein
LSEICLPEQLVEVRAHPTFAALIYKGSGTLIESGKILGAVLDRLCGRPMLG